MYEAVHARADGPSTVARLAVTAADCGFGGVVVRNRADAPAEYDAGRIAEEYGIGVVEGVELRARDPSRIAGPLGTHRREATVVSVRGGTDRINRFAARQGRVDVLAGPTRDGGDVDHVLVRTAAENGVRVEFDLGPVLREEGGDRVRAIGGLRKLRELVEDADAPFVVSASPASHLEIRGPRELVAVGEAIGFDREQVEAGLAEWGRIAERNAERLSGDYAAPGVRRGRRGER